MQILSYHALEMMERIIFFQKPGHRSIKEICHDKLKILQNLAHLL